MCTKKIAWGTPPARGGQKIVDKRTSSVLQFTHTAPIPGAKPAEPAGAVHMATFTRKNILKSGAGVYQIPGVIGIVTFGKQLLAAGASFPDTLTIDGLSTATPKAAAAKITKEERAAARASMTPAQKLSEQEARLAKQSANLAARKAKLAETAGAPA